MEEKRSTSIYTQERKYKKCNEGRKELKVKTGRKSEEMERNASIPRKKENEVRNERDQRQ